MQQFQKYRVNRYDELNNKAAETVPIQLFQVFSSIICHSERSEAK